MQYTGDTALITMSCSPLLLVGYLVTCVSRLEHWQWDWWIVISISKSTATMFVKAVRCICKPKPVKFLGDQLQWVQKAWYIRVTFETQRTLLAQISLAGKKAAQR
jgi:hypothetical protein